MRAMLYHADASASGPDFGPTRACATKKIVGRAGRTRECARTTREAVNSRMQQLMMQLRARWIYHTDYNCRTDVMSQKTLNIPVL
jgi:hypothetical protein